jgi:hypothetical protein
MAPGTRNPQAARDGLLISYVLCLADVYAALCHYLRDPEPIDAEIKSELSFNGRDGLASSSMTLPRVAGLHPKKKV